MENHPQVKLQLIMLQSFLSRSALVFLSATLILLTLACGRERENLATQNKQKLAQLSHSGKKSNPKVDQPLNTTPNSTDSQSNSKRDPRLEQQTESNFFEQALDKATGALHISQTALSRDDWLLVVAQYQDAIALLRKVQQQSIDYTMAQVKIAEYQRLMTHARQQAHLLKIKDVAVSDLQKPIHEMTDLGLPQFIPESEQAPLLTIPKESEPKEKQQLYPAKLPSPAHINQQISPKQASPQKTPSELENQQEIFAQQGLDYNQKPSVFTVPIKRRVGGTPVIEVNFNGNRQFEMIVDTGASGTVITQEMAKSLGVQAVGKAQANTASAKAVEFPIGYVDSIEAAGVQVNQVAVAIAGKNLEVGLLGHDFFGDYDLTIKRDVVELRPQSHSQFNSLRIQPTAPTSAKQPQIVGSP